jgi:hypothetical protein
MRTHRFGRKIKLPSTIAIKHQLRQLMFEDAVKKADEAALQRRDISTFGQSPDVTDATTKTQNGARLSSAG